MKRGKLYPGAFHQSGCMVKLGRMIPDRGFASTGRGDSTLIFRCEISFGRKIHLFFPCEKVTMLPKSSAKIVLSDFSPSGVKASSSSSPTYLSSFLFQSGRPEGRRMGGDCYWMRPLWLPSREKPEKGTLSQKGEHTGSSQKQLHFLL